MVKVSYDLKPYRRILMNSFGAEVYASPTDTTDYGRSVLAENPDNPGSLGIAISEAVEVAAKSGGTKKYGLGSVLNHVMIHTKRYRRRIPSNKWTWPANIPT